MAGPENSDRTPERRNASPDRRHANRRLEDAIGATGEPSSPAATRRRTSRELFQRFRQPLIGLGLAGLSLPMVQATTAAPADEEDAAERSDEEATAAQRAGLDTEEALAHRIGETRAQDERTREIDAAVERYDISRDLAADIYDIAREENIEPQLAFGLVKTESTFDERARSHVGARGLTQVMPRTAAWLMPGTQTEDLYDRRTNLRLGFRYLDRMIDKYNGDVRLALLAYNRGPGTVDKVLARGGDPDNGYAGKVLSG